MITIIVFMTTTSCYAYKYRYALDEALHDKIECVWEEGARYPSHIIYEGTVYKRVNDNLNLFCVSGSDGYENDVMLSWNGTRYISYIDEYYSNTTDNPMFIYEERLGWVYFREDYNYYTDIFIVENTDREIVIENIFGAKCEPIDIYSSNERHHIVMMSTTCNRIEIQVMLILFNGIWYVVLYSTHDTWIASSEFVDIVMEDIYVNKDS